MKTKTKAKKIYADLVRGRSRVRVVPAVDAALAEPPVFLVGAYRSGTTLTRLLLDSHPRIACPPETTLMNYLDPLASESTSLERLEGLGFDHEHVLAATRRYVSYFFESYASSRHKTRWADKSPENVWHLEFLRQLYPNAQFVLIVRHVLDQVHSHVTSPHDLTRRLRDYGLANGDDVRLAAARYWVAAVRAQLDFLARYPDASLLLRYEDLCAEPRIQMSRVLDFLGESWDPAVLEYASQEHDFGKSDDSALLSSRIALSTGAFRRWDSATLEQIEALAAPVLHELGWALPLRPGETSALAASG